MDHGAWPIIIHDSVLAPLHDWFKRDLRWPSVWWLFQWIQRWLLCIAQEALRARNCGRWWWWRLWSFLAFHQDQISFQGLENRLRASGFGYRYTWPLFLMVGSCHHVSFSQHVMQPRQGQRMSKSVTFLAKDIYVAGPPCTPFSVLNQKRLQENYHPFLLDSAAGPIIEVCRHVHSRKPKTFLIEEARFVGLSSIHAVLCSHLSSSLSWLSGLGFSCVRIRW